MKGGRHGDSTSPVADRCMWGFVSSRLIFRHFFFQCLRRSRRLQDPAQFLHDHRRARGGLRRRARAGRRAKPLSGRRLPDQLGELGQSQLSPERLSRSRQGVLDLRGASLQPRRGRRVPRLLGLAGQLDGLRHQPPDRLHRLGEPRGQRDHALRAPDQDHQRQDGRDRAIRAPGDHHAVRAFGDRGLEPGPCHPQPLGRLLPGRDPGRAHRGAARRLRVRPLDGGDRHPHRQPADRGHGPRPFLHGGLQARHPHPIHPDHIRDRPGEPLPERGSLPRRPDGEHLRHGRERLEVRPLGRRRLGQREPACARDECRQSRQGRLCPADPGRVDQADPDARHDAGRKARRLR